MLWIFSSRIDLSLFSVFTATLNDADATVTPPPDRASVASPVIDDVRPTASLWAGRNASCSRTRYPACEPAPRSQRPASPFAELVDELVAAALAVGVVSVNGFGEGVGRNTK